MFVLFFCKDTGFIRIFQKENAETQFMVHRTGSSGMSRSVFIAVFIVIFIVIFIVKIKIVP